MTTIELIMAVVWVVSSLVLVSRVERLEDDIRLHRALLGRLNGKVRAVAECDPAYNVDLTVIDEDQE